MKILLVTLDSKFIHANLAVRYLKKYCSNFDIEIKEFTINQKLDYVLGEILAEDAALICFSCYIWNIEYINEISYIIKESRNNAKILYGGPEVSYEIEKMMENNSFIDYIIFGEGEETFKEFLKEVKNPNPNLHKIKGLAFKENNDVIINESRELIEALDIINYPYESDEEFTNKIIYYESSRGCPFCCSFCMSSIDKRIRFFSMERVKKDLKKLLNTKARQIKFVDRTFNADYRRSMEIMQYIAENNKNNITVHFEITADIINDEFLNFIGKMPVNMFQFEIGVQSLNEDTLREINRHMDKDKLSHVIKEIGKNNNVHMHLDLITGLPYEDYESFKRSFDGIHNLNAEKIQLGFLKVLKGTKIYEDREIHQIKYRAKAPYEVICTKYISLEELLKLKNIEELVDKYYNEKYFNNSLKYIINNVFPDSAFKFYSSFSDYWQKYDLYNQAHRRKKLYKILYDYMEHINKMNDEFIQALKFDYIFNNQYEELPDYLNRESEDKFKSLKRNLVNDIDFKNKYFSSMEGKVINDFRIIEIGGNIILFVYRDKENTFNRCETYVVNNIEEAK
ncbi:MAG: DUF4080 domain-containing protein [Tissierellia bacterium]|jgi:radical SAM superfamily enzyme YgiQ (UPF0313 family)|nr:DUF4080 domain-containing protein [Tissierellia bacterium]MDD4678058.1 DUF4080 domain-containing protein [Tissierellia bacterium]